MKISAVLIVYSRSIFIIICMLIMSAMASAQDLEKEEQALVKSFLDIDQAESNSKDYDGWVKIAKADSSFLFLLIKYAQTDSNTLLYPFEKLKINGLSIITSPDGNFRIYSWDDRLGGTERFFEQVIQYRAGNNVKAAPRKTEHDSDTQFGYCTGIFQLNTGKTEIYVAYLYNIEMGSVHNEVLKGYTINADGLNDSLPIFKNEDGLTNEIFVEFNPTRLKKNDTTSNGHVIRYDASHKKIEVPEFDYLTNGFTGNKDIYIFKKRYFVKK